MLAKHTFETFLKKYPLVYKSSEDNENDKSSKLVCIRDCLPIFYLDNLVRLRRHGDPARSTYQTEQLCTLPLTIKGLPKDSAIVSSWHLRDCDSAENCSCMEETELSKTEQHLLTEYTDEAIMKCKLQATFGIGFITQELRNLVTECLDINSRKSSIKRLLNMMA